MDDELVDQLRASSADEAPESLLAAAKAAYSWRTTDGSLCSPTYDSLLDEGLASVRGEEDARLLSFASDALALDLEVSGSGERRSVVGQLTPPGPARITLRHGGAVEVDVSADDLGRFVADGLRPGPLSLRATTGEGVVHTEWVMV